MFLAEFPRRLRTVRESIPLTQAELAERVEVSRETVTKWENGTATPRASRLEKIYRALGISEREFWEYPLINDEGDRSKAIIEVIDPNPAPYCDVDVDENFRAIECPRCGSREHQQDKYARYCGDCGCPVYNLCTVDRDHINKPTFRRCGRCGAQTWWSLSEEQFVALLDRLAIGNMGSNEEE